ncbi:bifunctional serine/threonine-protein kinase/formylglycine-generating enzyme family protein [Candidatus Uabimicrobium sp. HlEnr_7]|uniref:bifunctional serine/threonine-protein kinase/formylglycine-generating enzyme family protein n=1 Tax=Candidatus Uabimicrobium helgolandensis TaxID=3095367 RepID=UPI00355612F0
MTDDLSENFLASLKTSNEKDFTQKIPTSLKRHIKNYHIHSPLGKGGMASVYKAIHIPSQKIVAIKVITNAKNKYIYDRFIREYKFLSSVCHENLIRAYELFQENNQMYMVLEFVEGTSLEDLFISGVKISLQDQLVIANKISCGIQILNTTGIIHRDIKPSNIMVNLEKGIVKILDLGISKDLHNEHSTKLTLGGNVVGTPMYLSPEQTKGKVTLTSDIFALGIVLYQLFTTTKYSPFNKKSAIGCMMAVNDETPPLVKNIIKTTPQNIVLYEEISNIVAKSMAKSPQDRWQNAGVIANFFARLHHQLVNPVIKNKFSISIIEQSLVDSLHSIKIQIQDKDVVAQYQSIPKRRTRQKPRQQKSSSALILSILTGAAVSIVFFTLYMSVNSSQQKRQRQKTPVKTSIINKKKSLPMDANVWKKCWNGKYFDFTNQKWEELQHYEKQLFVNKYQIWYAQNNHNLQDFRQEFTIANEKIKMLLIPPGKFWMGSRTIPQIPRRQITLSKPFWISESEFTQKQWRSVMGENHRPWQGKTLMLNPYNKKKYHVRDHNTHPTAFVSWNLITKILLRKLNNEYRLPTEAEWEYACRAGTSSLFFWGKNPLLITTYANVYDKEAGKKYYDRSTQMLLSSNPRLVQQFSYLKPLPVNDGFVEVTSVKSFRANAFGLYDMIGNVLEWCDDNYTPSTREAIDPVGTKYGKRVARGGSWSGYSFVIFRSEVRELYEATDAKSRIGFRLVKSLK